MNRASQCQCTNVAFWSLLEVIAAFDQQMTLRVKKSAVHWNALHEGESRRLLENVSHFPHPSQRAGYKVGSCAPGTAENIFFQRMIFFMILEKFYWQPRLICHSWPLYLGHFDHLEGMLNVTISFSNSVNDPWQKRSVTGKRRKKFLFLFFFTLSTSLWF